MNVQAQLLITIDEAGNIGVQGPINQKMLCYGLLDCARDAIKDHNDRIVAENKSRIQLATPGEMPSRDRALQFDAALKRNGDHNG